MNVASLLPFLKEIDRLKQVERQTLIHNGGRLENSAEHSWHLAIAVLLFKDLSKEPLNTEKALKMALLHDLVEIDAGDTFVYADSANKLEQELKAIERLTNLLPEHLAQDFKNTWLEFEEKQSPEAQFVAALDRFLPIYSNHLNDGHSWKNHNISIQQVFAKNQKPITTALPDLWEVASQMAQEGVARGTLQDR